MDFIGLLDELCQRKRPLGWVTPRAALLALHSLYPGDFSHPDDPRPRNHLPNLFEETEALKWLLANDPKALHAVPKELWDRLMKG